MNTADKTDDEIINMAFGGDIQAQAWVRRRIHENAAAVQPMALAADDRVICFVITYPDGARGNRDLFDRVRGDFVEAFVGTPWAAVPLFLLPAGWEFQTKRLSDVEKTE